MSALLQRHAVVSFLVLTYGVSLAAGLGAFALGGDETFTSPRALPLLLLTIWSPNIAAFAVSHAQGRVRVLLRGLLRRGTPLTWVIALLPLAVALLLALRAGAVATLPPASWALLVALNLLLGPLGEELGWRGFLLPALMPKLGTVGAALVVGVLWALWHAPLWWLPSPQSSISFSVFFATVICFSLIMTAIWQRSAGALGPQVLFHLATNVGVGWLGATGTLSAAEAYRGGLLFYGAAALMAAAYLAWQTRVAAPWRPSSKVGETGRIEGSSPIRRALEPPLRQRRAFQQLAWALQ